MRPWSRATPDEYAALPLRAHALLADVPLHDVWRVELPGGGSDRTIADVRALLAGGSRARANPAVRSLFALRRLLGRLFGWDETSPRAERRGDAPPAADPSYRSRLTDEDRRRSSVEPGSPDGIFTALYVHEREAVGEIRNATVHAFSVYALEPRVDGYRLYWAIHVAPVGRITSLYMALIDPFRRLVVYPAILEQLHRAWCARVPRRNEGLGAPE